MGARLKDANYTMEHRVHLTRSFWDKRSPALVGSHTEIVTKDTPGLSARRHWLMRAASATAVVAAMLVLATRLLAHEIPTDVVIQSYLKPEADNVTLLLRAPLEAMRDVDIPQRGPGYINIGEAEPFLRDAAEIWLANFIRIYADGKLLDQWQIEAVRLELPSDRSFADFDRARANVASPPLSADTELYRDQALLDVEIRYALDGATEFAVQPEFGRLGLRTTTVLNFLPSDGVQRVFEFSGSPGLVPLDPRWHQAFFRFIRLGIDHILVGIDHILFVLCLIIPFRRIRPLVVIVTSFTVAHSITLCAAAFGLAPKALWFPPLIETLIALSIVYMAFENIVGSRWDRRWIIAFGFGLVHGFGFSFALSETLQFAGGHLLTSLLAFNIGVEIGQLLIIAVAVPLLNLLFRKAVAERTGTIILSALLAHSGWHWMSDRVGDLSAYSFSWPVLNAAFAASSMRWLMLFMIVALAVWLLYWLYRRLALGGTDGASNRERLL